MAGLNVGEATTWLLGRLDPAMAPALVGDGVAPEAAGWPEGTPNSASAFVPYVVLKGTQSSPMQATTPLCRTWSSTFEVTYRLASFHTGRSEADALIAEAVEALRALNVVGDEVVVGGNMKVFPHRAWLDSIAAAVRDDSTYPKLWSGQATFRLGMAWFND